ncbi:MAG: lantibiotic dehydratase [Verrucomicrobia bacterium]|nr:lantibiotic dehydratase [Verrucomicrobiota bacterium]
MKSEALFLPASFFLVRNPSLPFESFKKQDRNTIYSFYAQNELFQEAIAIASPTLAEELKKTSINDQMKATLLKYFYRMTSRSTPFGLFSLVSSGCWNEVTAAELDLDLVIKGVRPDMQWVLKIGDQICKDENVFSQILVQCNPLLTIQGDRYTIGYLLEKPDQKGISIRISPLTKAIFTAARNSITIENLIKSILMQLPTLEDHKVQEVIRKLIDQQFLWFSIFPSLLSPTPFQEFLDKIPEPYASALHEIRLELELYSKTAPGKGRLLLENATIKMKEMADSSCYIQVDQGIPKTSVKLPFHIGLEAAQAAEALWKLSFDRDPFGLQSYLSQFLNRYGTDRIIPLLELLDENRGLGLPEGLKTQSSQDDRFQQWLNNELAQAFWDRRLEIVIDKSLIEKLSVNSPLQKAPLSIDLFFELIANSPDEVDKANYLLLLTNLTWQGGSSCSRFLKVLGHSFQQELQQFLGEEEALDPGLTFVESSFLPPKSRSQNVAIHPNLRKEVIDLSPAGKSTISLEDLYVGATTDGLFLVSKDGTKQFYVTAGNVLNPTYAPPPLRFAREISKSRYDLMAPFVWRKLEGFPVLPRIRFQKTILSPAEWRVSLDKLEKGDKDGFRKWAKIWQMPRLVFLTNGDQRLLLDIESNDDLEIILDQIKKSHSIKLVEKIEQEQGQWVSSQKGKHSVEFVLPLRKNPLFGHLNSVEKKPFYEEIASEARWRLPGSEWLFVNFYLSKDNEEKFLTKHLTSFTQYLQEQKLINQWFFVRYRDERSHIRVRFQGFSLSHLHDWSNSLIEEGIISKISLESYEREIERYGGQQAIELAEQFFCEDSQVVLQLLKKKNQIGLPDFILGTLSILDLVKYVDGFFDHYGIDREALDGFREWKKILLSPIDPQILEAFDLRREALINLVEALDIQKKYKVANSLVHMHCNRFFGTNEKLEKKSRAYACHTLKQQKFLEVSFSR